MFSRENLVGNCVFCCSGRSVLITFQDSDVRDALLKGTWMDHWFESSKPWQGEPASLERFVWLSCSWFPLNAWNANTFKRIGEVWGHFIMMDEDTLNNWDLAKGKVLIATLETSRIEKWIQVVIQGKRYEVLVKEEASYLYPEEIGQWIDPVQKKGDVYSSGEQSQSEGGSSPVMAEKKGEDGDMESQIQIPTNESGGVGEGFSGDRGTKEMVWQRVGAFQVEVRGPKHRSADHHLMLSSPSDEAHEEELESAVEESVDMGVKDLRTQAQVVGQTISFSEKGAYGPAK